MEIRKAAGNGTEELRPILRELVSHIGSLSGSSKGPTIVIAIDQAEELFRTGGAEEGKSLLTLLRDLIVADDPPFAALLLIRSDSYDALENTKPLEGVSQKTFPLLPMPRTSYRKVIEGPVTRLVQAGRRFEWSCPDRGITAHLEKGETSDALPLSGVYAAANFP